MNSRLSNFGVIDRVRGQDLFDELSLKALLSHTAAHGIPQPPLPTRKKNHSLAEGAAMSARQSQQVRRDQEMAEAAATTAAAATAAAAEAAAAAREAAAAAREAAAIEKNRRGFAEGMKKAITRTAAAEKLFAEKFDKENEKKKKNAADEKKRKREKHLAKMAAKEEAERSGKRNKRR